MRTHVCGLWASAEQRKTAEQSQNASCCVTGSTPTAPHSAVGCGRATTPCLRDVPLLSRVRALPMRARSSQPYTHNLCCGRIDTSASMRGDPLVQMSLVVNPIAVVVGPLCEPQW
jgi:hypothetical protein